MKVDQRHVAGLLGLANVTTWSNWESGRSQPRDPVTIARRLEMVSRVPADWTLGLDPSGGTEDAMPMSQFMWINAQQDAQGFARYVELVREMAVMRAEEGAAGGASEDDWLRAARRLDRSERGAAAAADTTEGVDSVTPGANAGKSSSYSNAGRAVSALPAGHGRVTDPGPSIGGRQAA